jgi:hypothetical protein
MLQFNFTYSQFYLFAPTAFKLLPENFETVGVRSVNFWVINDPNVLFGEIMSVRSK